MAMLALGCNENSTNKKQSNERYFTTHSGSKAFSKPFAAMTEVEDGHFAIGKSFFSIPWVEAPSATTARDGLGPLFNANTCRNCHPNNGAGIVRNKDGSLGRSLLLRLSHRTSSNHDLLQKNGFEADSTYGAQLSRNGNQNVLREGTLNVRYRALKGNYPDGTAYALRQPTYSIVDLNYGMLDKESVLAPRIGSALIGLGLLEQILEKDLLAYEDINDNNRDGISGKANYAYSPETNSTMMGRFTWKASATSVKHQSAAAAHNDMGLSSPLFPLPNCTSKQKACLQEASKGRFVFDLPAKRLDAIAYYLSNLAVPKRREIGKHLEGEKIFASLGCVACHVPSYQTKKGVEIHPYTDLLLHDMGEALADGRTEFLATGEEWRTAPLWGKGLYKEVSGAVNLLHDGRARSVEEAILWHGGEAEKSKKEFMALSKKKRDKMLRFLNAI